MSELKNINSLNNQALSRKLLEVENKQLNKQVAELTARAEQAEARGNVLRDVLSRFVYSESGASIIFFPFKRDVDRALTCNADNKPPKPSELCHTCRYNNKNAKQYLTA